VPPLSLTILPTSDDQEVVDTVAAAVGLEFPDLEIIVVVDGEQGSLLQSLTEAFQLSPTFRVYRHENALLARAHRPRLGDLPESSSSSTRPQAGAADRAQRRHQRVEQPAVRLDRRGHHPWPPGRSTLLEGSCRRRPR